MNKIETLTKEQRLEQLEAIIQFRAKVQNKTPLEVSREIVQEIELIYKAKLNKT